MLIRQQLLETPIGRRVLSDIEEFERDNRRDPAESHTEAFCRFLEWNGIIGYSSIIREALWELITSTEEYLETTDKDREEWLARLLGVDR